MESHFGHLLVLHLLLLLLLLAISSVVSSQSTIKTLPGFAGDLPFKLETGYVGVGKKEEIQLFYYFVESENSPEHDPFILWLVGGPGCSALSPFFYEIGPLSFDYGKSSWNSTTLLYNPYSWTKVANILFVDSPVGTGFSYSTTWQAYNTSDTLSAAMNYNFLRKWFMTHPMFLKNPLYVGGDSYSGIVVPITVQEISNGNEGGAEPLMNLKGFILGNPFTDKHAKINCKGDYVNIDNENVLCRNDMDAFHKCTADLFRFHILEPSCPITASQKPALLELHPSRALIEDYSIDLLLPLSHIPKDHPSMCRSYHLLYCHAWANDQKVQNALQIRKGSKETWVRCNKTLSSEYNYDVYDVSSSVEYHRNLISKGYRLLVFSGDQDLAVPYVGTLAWIGTLNLTISHAWTPWFVDGQVAGYTVLYSDKKHGLTFATVKDAGHTPPEYRPKECLAMVDRWLAHRPLYSE